MWCQRTIEEPMYHGTILTRVFCSATRFHKRHIIGRVKPMVNRFIHEIPRRDVSRKNLTMRKSNFCIDIGLNYAYSRRFGELLAEIPQICRF